MDITQLHKDSADNIETMRTVFREAMHSLQQVARTYKTITVIEFVDKGRHTFKGEIIFFGYKEEGITYQESLFCGVEADESNDVFIVGSQNQRVPIDNVLLEDIVYINDHLLNFLTQNPKSHATQN